MSTTNIQKIKSDVKPAQYKRPLSISPWAKGAESENGSVWVSMKPKKILDQYSKGAGTFDTVDTQTEFLFLAPLALNENIIHHWEAYESVASRMAQKARSIVKLGSEGVALANVGKKFFTQEGVASDVITTKGLNEGSTIEDYAVKAYGAIQGSRIPKIKVDTPLYYSNSDRRQLVFEFQLFSENIQGFSTKDILLKPIQELMKYSSPELKNEGGIQIEFPYMWEVKTIPKAFIKYTSCALTGVQPTWNSPYINGYPSSCNLQLTFIDLSPLYASTIEEGSIINVKSGSVNTALKRDREAAKKYEVTPKIIKVNRADAGR